LWCLKYYPNTGWACFLFGLTVVNQILFDGKTNADRMKIKKSALQLALYNGLGVYMTAGTNASTNDQWVCPALVSLSKTKPDQFSLVRSLCTRF